MTKIRFILYYLHFLFLRLSGRQFFPYNKEVDILVRLTLQAGVRAIVNSGYARTLDIKRYDGSFLRIWNGGRWGYWCSTAILFTQGSPTIVAKGMPSVITRARLRLLVKESGL